MQVMCAVLTRATCGLINRRGFPVRNTPRAEMKSHIHSTRINFGDYLSDAGLRALEALETKFREDEMAGQTRWLRSLCQAKYGDELGTEYMAYMDLKNPTAIVSKFRNHEFSSAVLWYKLDALVFEQNITSSARRQLFWDLHSTQGRSWLERQCAYFHPQCGVWMSNDDAAIRQAEFLLSRIMRLSRLNASTPLPGYCNPKFVLERVSLFLVLIAICLAIHPALLRLSVFVAPFFLTFYIKILQISFSRLKSDKALVHAIRDAPTQAKAGSEFEAWFEYGVSKPFLDPARLEALLLRFEREEISSARLWMKFNSLVRSGLLSRSERNSLFWRLHTEEEKRILVKQCPFFFPGHMVWDGNDDAGASPDKDLFKWCKGVCEVETLCDCCNFVVGLLKMILHRSQRNQRRLQGIYLYYIYSGSS